MQSNMVNNMHVVVKMHTTNIHLQQTDMKFALHKQVFCIQELLISTQINTRNNNKTIKAIYFMYNLSSWSFKYFLNQHFSYIYFRLLFKWTWWNYNYNQA